MLNDYYLVLDKSGNMVKCFTDREQKTAQEFAKENNCIVRGVTVELPLKSDKQLELRFCK